MEFGFTQIASVVWLGILTSISPCPMATNIAATTYIGRQINSPLATVWAAVAYTLGRTAAYVVIATAIIAGLISIPGVSLFLQAHINKLLGPVLFITGVFILDLIRLRLPSMNLSTNLLKRLGDSGMPGAVALGFLFALAFCPVSAALFFGGVIPLSLESQSRFFLPLLYGVGTAAPVIGFAVVIAYSARIAGLFFNRLAVFERWFRRLTGAVFVVTGLYFCLKYIFRVINF